MNSPKRLRIAILGGTGAEGSGLALRWAHAGHEVVIGSRNPEAGNAKVMQLNGLLRGTCPITCSTNQDSARAAEIIVLTVPHAAQKQTVMDIADALKGKILIDATVPLVPPKVNRVQLPIGGSAVAAMQAMLGPSVRVVSAFQNVSAHLLKDMVHQIDCDVLVCGDDPGARQVVIGLIADLGLRGIHAGPICNSAAAEALTSILISINMAYKVPGSGIRITGLPFQEAS